MEEARKKIEAEMAKAAANAPLQHLGRLLLQHLRTNPGAAPAILTKDKTLAGALDKMRSEAQHHKTGNVGVLTDEEGLNIALNYFGVTATAPATAAPRSTFDVKLDDLLEGL